MSALDESTADADNDGKHQLLKQHATTLETVVLN